MTAPALLSQRMLHVCAQVGEEVHRGGLQACEKGLEQHHLVPVQHALVAEELDEWVLVSRAWLRLLRRLRSLAIPSPAVARHPRLRCDS